MACSNLFAMLVIALLLNTAAAESFDNDAVATNAVTAKGDHEIAVKEIMEGHPWEEGEIFPPTAQNVSVPHTSKSV